jgi:hypothetical protein
MCSEKNKVFNEIEKFCSHAINQIILYRFIVEDSGETVSLPHVDAVPLVLFLL